MREEGGNEEDVAPATDGTVGIDLTAPDEIDLTAPETPVKRKPDHRRWCFRCTYKVYTEVEGRRKPTNVSRFPGCKPKKTSTVCMRCEVALCDKCFRPWHEEILLPSLPTDSTETHE